MARNDLKRKKNNNNNKTEDENDLRDWHAAVLQPQHVYYVYRPDNATTAAVVPNHNISSSRCALPHIII